MGRPRKNPVIQSGQRSTVTYADPPSAPPALSPEQQHEQSEVARHLAVLQQKQQADLEARAKYGAFDGPAVVDPMRLLQEQQAAEQIARGTFAYEQLAQQAQQANAVASLIEGYPVEEGLARPSQQPVNIQELLAQEMQGIPFTPPQLVVSPPFQGAQFQQPVYQRPPMEYQMPSQYIPPPELKRGKPAPANCLRDLDGNLFFREAVQGVDVIAGSGVAGATCKRVVAHTNLGERIMAVAVNADDLAEWYRDAIMMFVAGETETLPQTPGSETDALLAVA